MTAVKICGIKDPETFTATVDAGADFIGLVFYEPSPRYIVPENAALLSHLPRKNARIVGLFVNPTDQELLHTLSQANLDMIQLHGEESPQRVAQIAALSNLPVIKALGLRGPEDLDNVAAYEEVADWLLFDYKADHPTLPGGTGQSFDWAILQGKTFKKPWMLSGGLTPENAVEALKTLKPDALDVSSGVESARGIKDPAKIRAFIDAAKFA